MSLVALVVVAGTPFRSYVDQRRRIRAVSAEAAVLDKRNQELATQVSRLQTPAEIERQARTQYGMIRPGETAYALLPAPVGPLHLPALWPYKR